MTTHVHEHRPASSRRAHLVSDIGTQRRDIPAQLVHISLELGHLLGRRRRRRSCRRRRRLCVCCERGDLILEREHLGRLAHELRVKGREASLQSLLQRCRLLLGVQHGRRALLLQLAHLVCMHGRQPRYLRPCRVAVAGCRRQLLSQRCDLRLLRRNRPAHASDFCCLCSSALFVLRVGSQCL